MDISLLESRIGELKDNYDDFFRFFRENYPRARGGLYVRAKEAIENMDITEDEQKIFIELLEACVCLTLNIGPYQPLAYRDKLFGACSLMRKSEQFTKILYTIYSTQRLSAQALSLKKELDLIAQMKIASTESLSRKFRLLPEKVADGVRVFMQYPGDIRDLGRKVQARIKKISGE